MQLPLHHLGGAGAAPPAQPAVPAALLSPGMVGGALRFLGPRPPLPAAPPPPPARSTRQLSSVTLPGLPGPPARPRPPPQVSRRLQPPGSQVARGPAPGPAPPGPVAGSRTAGTEEGPRKSPTSPSQHPSPATKHTSLKGPEGMAGPLQGSPGCPPAPVESFGPYSLIHERSENTVTHVYPS
ncbi:uncharacterized protein LOC132538189 [Erinaceus europaeus]|uniref:Uncharacterized protein LOC132538189 n=1 Tax=Erinaceus europaeus TaxID=9365 RepID=A0ABM3XD63_ERIEU|nr:uncharacterized protein LOC132538189 [Erinaceus europaeus]